MSNQFNWKVAEDQIDQLPEELAKSSRSSVLGFWLFALLLLLVVFAGWAFYRYRSEKDTEHLMKEVQDILDIQQRAVVAGDGDLFFLTQAGDPQWLAAQLLPYNQAVNRAGLTVSNASEHGAIVWVNATWSEKGGIKQRILFFEPRAGYLRQIPTDPSYWGTILRTDFHWGTLKYHAVDDLWATAISRYIAEVIDDTCWRSCPAGQLPLTVEIRSDYQETAEPGHIYIPSPRLLGLDERGQPASEYWALLDRRIISYLTPATIRFAVPPSRSHSGLTLVNYQRLAEKFMESHPEISIELVYLDELPDDLAVLGAEFDGAAIPPTEAMLAAGLVRNLDDFIKSDPEFDESDFYDQIWQGAIWREGTWFMPQAAEMHILYYDLAAYQNAEYEYPSARWTWEEMAQDVSTIVAAQPGDHELAWGFLDVGLDALYSYAYNWNNQCKADAQGLCLTPLEEQNVAAALDWYAQMVYQPGETPDLTHNISEILSPAQMSSLENKLREDPYSLLLNMQGAHRKSAIWVDLPVNYEFNRLLSPVGMVPFPGSDRFDGITPLWLQGSFISHNSSQPLAVWQWLKYLSYKAPVARYVPARPSVAAEVNYWTNLPRHLGEVLRIAFPFARPILVNEQEMITWDQVMAVVGGESTPAQAALQQKEIKWFAE